MKLRKFLLVTTNFVTISTITAVSCTAPLPQKRQFTIQNVNEITVTQTSAQFTAKITGLQGTDQLNVKINDTVHNFTVSSLNKPADNEYKITITGLTKGTTYELDTIKVNNDTSFNVKRPFTTLNHVVATNPPIENREQEEPANPNPPREENTHSNPGTKEPVTEDPKTVTKQPEAEKPNNSTYNKPSGSDNSEKVDQQPTPLLNSGSDAQEGSKPNDNKSGSKTQTSDSDSTNTNQIDTEKEAINENEPTSDNTIDNNAYKGQEESKDPSKPIHEAKPLVPLHNFLPISENEVFLTANITNEEKQQSLVKLNESIYTSLDKVEEKIRGKQPFLEYLDPETELIFREYSYTNDDGKTYNYLLGKQGLLMLVHEFKRKIPYGQEIKDLQALILNDYKAIDENANGLYMPDSRRIFVNGSGAQNKQFDLYEIIGFLMPTIIHEYMHHWASVYAEIGLIEDPKIDVKNEVAKDLNKRQTTEIYYNPPQNNTNDGHSHGARQFWNSYFTSYFYSLLNYDIDKKGYINPEILKKFGIPDEIKDYLLFQNLSVNDLWRLANELETPDHLKKYPTSETPLFFSPGGSFYTYTPRLKYTFSLTELVPREYTKYAYESYFSINDQNKSYMNEETKPNSVNWFGAWYFNIDSSGYVSGSFSPSGNAEDWSHTYLNNFDSPIRQGWFQSGEGVNLYDNSPKFNAATAMPNSIFDINKFRYLNDLNQITELPAEKTKNRANEFYKLFLETMGYGKTISQIYTYSETSNSEQGLEMTSTRYPTLLRFSGFIDSSKKVDGLVLKRNDQIYNQVKFDYSNAFNFFGKSNYDEGASLYEIADDQNLKITKDRQTQINKRIYPDDVGYSANYLSYITKEFINVKDNSTIHLWIDKDNDGKATNDELIDQEITLPTQRAVTTQRATNATYSKFEKFLIQSENGLTTLKQIKQ